MGGHDLCHVAFKFHVLDGEVLDHWPSVSQRANPDLDEALVLLDQALQAMASDDLPPVSLGVRIADFLARHKEAV